MQENKFIAPVGEYRETYNGIECPTHILIERLAELGIVDKQNTAARSAVARYNNRKGE